MLFDIVQAGISLFSEPHETRWNSYGIQGEKLLFFRNFKKSINWKYVQKI